jgi:hypothetical protein
MRNRADIDEKTSRAIIREIGERLRVILKEDPKVPANLRLQIDRLSQEENPSPPAAGGRRVVG